MKKVLLIGIILLAAWSGRAQVAFQDARVIRDRCVTVTGTSFAFKTDNASSVIFIDILKNYLSQTARGNTSLSDATVLAGFSDNPFFQAEFDAFKNSPAFAAPRIAPAVSSVAGKLGGLNVTTVADGLARFLVERTKTELDVYFFERFKEFLQSSSFGSDLRVLFPNTHSVLMVIGDEIYNYQMYLQALREAFTHDLAALLVNTNRWINQPNPTGALLTAIQASQLYPYLQLALQLAVDLQAGKHPGDILNSMAARDFSNTAAWGEFGSIVRGANLISQSLRSNDPGRYWISEEDFGAFQDVTFARLYFGLLYWRAEMLGVQIGRTPVTDLLRPLATRIDQGREFVSELKPLLVQADQIITQIKGDSERGIAENYILLGNTILDIANLTNTSLFTAANVTLFPAGALDNPQFFLTHSANLLADVRTKSYSAGVIELSLILQKMSVNQDFLNGVIKYGTFMAGVATAKTSEEVQQAIEVVALPPGSYRVKRESHANISLNAYVGFYAGNEHMPASEKQDSFSAGLFAPVGFAFSLGGIKCKPERGGKSVSLFASIIDVGALASFRFKDDNTAVSSEVKLKDIVAPGLFLIHGFGKSPISIGAGVQMGPALRDVNPAGAADINKDYYVRAAGFIAVDIPVFNLYNRKDRKN